MLVQANRNVCLQEIVARKLGKCLESDVPFLKTVRQRAINLLFFTFNVTLLRIFLVVDQNYNKKVMRKICLNSKLKGLHNLKSRRFAHDSIQPTKAYFHTNFPYSAAYNS